VKADRLSRRRRRRDGENFKDFQAVIARVVSSPTGLEFF